MARLTDREYLDRHNHLRELWSTRSRVFSLLDARDQLYLHRYYSPAVSEADELHIAHRKRVSQSEPSLPHSAGRAYSKLQDYMKNGTSPDGVTRILYTRKNRPDRMISVRAVVKPEIDLDKYARAIVRNALERPGARDMEGDTST